jgi:hypothetical protein
MARPNGGAGGAVRAEIWRPLKAVENEPAPGAAADAAPSGDELSSADLLSEALLDAGGRVIADLRREWGRELEIMQAKSREIIAVLERDRERDPLKAEIAELRVRLDMLVAVVLGKSVNFTESKRGDVIDVPIGGSAPMSRNFRPLIRPHFNLLAEAFAEAKADLVQMAYEHQCELAQLRRELVEVRALYDELRAVTLARQQADAEVAELHRLRAIARAQAAERDPNAPLN